MNFLFISDNWGEQKMAEKEFCAYCDQEMQPILKNQKFRFMIANREKIIIVSNVPAQYCPTCNETFYDFSLDVKIEKMLNKEILTRLNRLYKQPLDEIPEQFDYLNKNNWVTR